MKAMPEWVASGALKNVNQLAIEIHSFIHNEKSQYYDLLLIMKDLYNIGFRIISYDANLIVGRKNAEDEFMHIVNEMEHSGTFYTPLFELVLMKDVS